MFPGGFVCVFGYLVVGFWIINRPSGALLEPGSAQRRLVLIGRIQFRGRWLVLDPSWSLLTPRWEGLLSPHHPLHSLPHFPPLTWQDQTRQEGKVWIALATDPSTAGATAMQ